MNCEMQANVLAETFLELCKIIQHTAPKTFAFSLLPLTSDPLMVNVHKNTLQYFYISNVYASWHFFPIMIYLYLQQIIDAAN